MAELNDLVANLDVVRSGAWITVGAEPNTFEIKTRGITNAYRDGLNRLRREAAREANRRLRPGEAFYSPDALPPTIDDRCQGQAIAEHCFLDVRGLTSNGQPVTGEQFKALLLEPEGKSMILALAIGAAFRVAEDARADTEQAEGNLSPASASA